MSRPTVSRSQLLADLRELHRLLDRWLYLKGQLDDPRSRDMFLEPFDLGSWAAAAGVQSSPPSRFREPANEVYLKKAQADVTPVIRLLRDRLLPKGTKHTLSLVEFCIQAIDSGRARSMREAVNQYEDRRERREAEERAERRHQEAMREARLNADHIAQNAAMNQAMSDYFRNH